MYAYCLNNPVNRIDPDGMCSYHSFGGYSGKSDCGKSTCSSSKNYLRYGSAPNNNAPTPSAPSTATKIVVASHSVLASNHGLDGINQCGNFGARVLTNVGIVPPDGYSWVPNWQKDGRFTYTLGMDGILPGDIIVWDKPTDNFPQGNGDADHISFYVGNKTAIGGGELVNGNWVVAALPLNDDYSCSYYSTAFPIGYIRVY